MYYADVFSSRVGPVDFKDDSETGGERMASVPLIDVDATARRSAPRCWRRLTTVPSVSWPTMTQGYYFEFNQWRPFLLIHLPLNEACSLLHAFVLSNKIFPFVI